MHLPEVRDQLVARAAALGIARDTEEATIDALLEREVEVAPPSEAECRAYFEAHPDLFRSGELIEADHILFAVTDAVPLEALRTRAQQVLDEIRADPDSLAALAQQLSNCPSAQVGGNLGQLTRADVVPEFWQVVATFAENEGAGVLPRLVETRYGLHIVRVARYLPGKPLPFEAVRDSIAARLAQRALHAALRDYAHALFHSTGHAH